jgi:hypothetical protein
LRRYIHECTEVSSLAMICDVENFERIGI